MAKLEERLNKLSDRLAELSVKADEASKEVQAARELKEEAVKDRIETVRGDVAAMEENMRIEGEEKKGKFRSAVLKARMTIEAKVEDHKEARDKRFLEDYMETQLLHIVDCYDTATYLIAEAELSMLELIDVANEYEARFGEKPEVSDEEKA